MSWDGSENGTGREEGLECPICWESFNIVENVPYVLWCGHTLCKNCILGLRWSVLKLPTVPLQLPLFITCPWCGLLSLRLVLRGTLSFPRKNFFLLWMVHNMNPEEPHKPGPPDSPPQNHDPVLRRRRQHHPTTERPDSSLRRCIGLFVHLAAKLPLVAVFLLVVLYVIPASVVVLALYAIVTIFFGLPSFLVLYFAYPCLEWLVREIVVGRG